MELVAHHIILSSLVWLCPDGYGDCKSLYYYVTNHNDTLEHAILTKGQAVVLFVNILTKMVAPNYIQYKLGNSINFYMHGNRVAMNYFYVLVATHYILH